MAQAAAQMADERGGERDEAIGNAAAHHQFAGEDEERDREQRDFVEARRHLLHHHDRRQAKINHRRQAPRRQRERDRHAGDSSNGENAEEKRDLHQRLGLHRRFGVRIGRVAEDEALQRKHARSARRRRRGRYAPRLRGRARRPSARSRNSTIRKPPNPASATPNASAIRRASAFSTARTALGELSTSVGNAKCDSARTAIGCAEQRGDAHQRHARQVRSSSANRSARSGRTLATRARRTSAHSDVAAMAIVAAASAPKAPFSAPFLPTRRLRRFLCVRFDAPARSSAIVFDRADSAASSVRRRARNASVSASLY